jgi:squalene synthase HpnC
MQALRDLGPGAPASDPPSLEASIAYCRGLALAHYENFSVLTSLVPKDLRDDFAAVYAFCRWSDDLADETGATDAARRDALDLLGWWRAQLRSAFDSGTAGATHPVFIALRATAQRRGLTSRPFHDLLDAFEQDQRVTRYQTWDQCVDYCTRSANPVGRIVLALGGYADTPENAERYAMSDATCTALQLINFWQDVSRDLRDRDRIYIPLAETGLSEELLRDWAARPSDPTARVPLIRALRPLVDRTADLFDRGRPLPRTLDRRLAPVVWLFGAGGDAILSAVRGVGCATLWGRPSLSKATKAALVGRAWVWSRLP